MSADLTVFIPTYNRSGFLRECLTALLDQGLTRDELVVMVSDNASTDDTEQVARSFEDRLQVVYRRNEANTSSMENINLAGSLVTTPYLSILCDDDLLPPGQLGRALRCLRAHPDGACYGALGLGQHAFGDLGAIPLGLLLDPEPVPDEPFLFRWGELAFLANCAIHTPLTIIGSVFRLDAIEERPLFAYPQEGDRLLFLRVVGRGTVYSSPWIGGHLRLHPAQATHGNDEGDTRTVCRHVLERAEELGHDVPGYWVERLAGADERELQAYCPLIQRSFPPELSKEVLERAGVARRWKDLKRKRKLQKYRPGLMWKVRRFFGGVPVSS